MKDVCPVSGTTVFTRFSLSLNVGLKNDADYQTTCYLLLSTDLSKVFGCLSLDFMIAKLRTNGLDILSLR